MVKYIIKYGILLALIAIILTINEYWFWFKMKSFNIYGIIVAVLFLGLGLYFGKKKNKLELQGSALNKSIEYEINEKVSDLSKREKQVLLYMAKGFTNLQIAEQLYISENTVKTHISRIFEKLHVKNRTTALIKAKETGIIKELM
ncbi:MAG TPA: response regulator transcription factor [Saprospiraceae bacterium]|nr:response regulator transcription factor [Saprospiraceae bacterium]